MSVLASKNFGLAKNSPVRFILLVGLYLSLTYISNIILYDKEFLINLVGRDFENFLKVRKQIDTFGYFLIPVFFLCKILLISFILDFGCYLYGKEIDYKALFGIVVKAEYILLLPVLFKTIWFSYFQKNYDLKDLQLFYPLSLSNLVEYKDLGIWWIYPLQIINVFEVFYWIILAYNLDKTLKTPENKNTGIKIVASSYGVGLLIWVISVMFFTLNLN
ncbi:hypothetical protein [Flagellimonas crocea]|uniref:hypothetical protein n=1 Tax=Flagellimonas crocea TaxID=3067311 RepID=UPI00296E5ED5|nr:hypothetical protein [Muricauda sp. DH64]